MANKKLADFTDFTDESLIDLANDFLVGNDNSAVDAVKDTRYTFELLMRLFNIGVNQDETGTPLSSTTSLAINANTNFVKILLSGDWNPTAITGFQEGKRVVIQVGISGSNPTYPYQITFPSTVTADDGVTPVFKNNDNTKFDYVVLVGKGDKTAQIEKIIYGG